MNDNRIQEIMRAYSSIQNLADNISKMSVSECEDAGDEILQGGKRTCINFLAANVDICSAEENFPNSNFENYHISTNNVSLLSFVLRSIGDALEGSTYDIGYEHYKPFIGVLLCTTALSVEEIEEHYSPKEAKVVLKDNLCSLFAGLIRNEVNFLLERVNGYSLAIKQ